MPVLDNIEITRACLQHLYGNTKVDRLGLQVSVLLFDNGSKEDIDAILRQERCVPQLVRCSTRQGPHFDGRKWDKAREFGKFLKYYTKLLP